MNYGKTTTIETAIVRLKYFVFRVDGSLVIGLGHIMRCITLANTFDRARYQCLFVCRDYGDQCLEAIVANDHLLVRLKPSLRPDPNNIQTWLGSTIEEDLKDFNCILRSLGDNVIEGIVVDHYAIDQRWEEATSLSSKIIVIDDLANRRHHCKVLIDQSFGRSALDYRSLVDSSTTLLVGPKYCLLRPEFALVDPISRIEDDPNILIMMGGTDNHNITCKVIKALIPLQNKCKLSVIVGSQCVHLTEICNLSRDLENFVYLYIDCQDIASVMEKCTLAIGSIGGSTWERFAAALPSLCITTSNHQIEFARKLANIIGFQYLGHYNTVTKKTIYRHVLKFIESRSSEDYRALRNICDGNGANRVAEFLGDLYDDHIDRTQSCWQKL